MIKDEYTSYEVENLYKKYENPFDFITGFKVVARFKDQENEDVEVIIKGNTANIYHYTLVGFMKNSQKWQGGFRASISFKSVESFLYSKKNSHVWEQTEFQKIITELTYIPKFKRGFKKNRDRISLIKS